MKEADLEGTPALEEWNELEEEIPEIYDSDEDIARKSAIFAEWLRGSVRPAWLVGAGVSSSVLPTFRGSHGLWTRGRLAPKAREELQASTSYSPTFAHTALAKLAEIGKVNWLASQNYDNLLLRAGFPAERLSELHGNIFQETCTACGHVYTRDFEVELSTSTDHETGRFCDQPGRKGPCGGALKDNIVHFSESLPWHAITMANAKFLGADLTVVLGSSLKVDPAASLPFKAKRRQRFGKTRAVIVNLQPTPRDAEADLVIHARAEDVLRHVLAALLPSTEVAAK